MAVLERKTPTGTASFHEIHVRNEFHAWCRLLWEDNGWVIILSDYGHWAHWWGHRGEGVTVAKFLAKLDMHYMGGKMLAGEIDEYSLESTVHAIRERIIFERRNGYIDKETARSEREKSQQLESGELTYEMWHMESAFDDAYECKRTEINNTWVQFWKRLWEPMIQPILREEALKEVS